MPKMQTVTDDEVQSLARDIEMFVQDAQDFADRILRGYSEQITNRAAVIRHLTAACRNFSELSLALMAQERMAAQDAELSALRASLPKEG